MWVMKLGLSCYQVRRQCQFHDLTHYMKPISFQPKASVVCSVTTSIFIGFWNADQVSVSITSWDITLWCSINLLWKELMERMSEHTCLISSLSLLLVQTQAARWKAATPEQLTGAHLYFGIAKSGYLFHGYSGGMWGIEPMVRYCAGRDTWWWEIMIALSILLNFTMEKIPTW